MPVTLNFSSKGLINLRERYVRFRNFPRTYTKDGWTGRSLTVVQGQNLFAGIRATIDWKDKYFEIHGKVVRQTSE
ncbi:hypothetical protein BD626DRAFT_481422 [Schizophyllum amplum]|uniref:Uncharacterized protein n=1 Tax=Schizophyllum amplum TaxID=97359 RepID=A0A550CU74_9AGAR|nr:hypothetical protein BD626DRAFT_481422 [Auriculariopsis ampla]